MRKTWNGDIMDDLLQSKKCPECGKEQSLSQFGVGKNAKRLSIRCKSCRRDSKDRASMLRFHYGITLQDYADMERAQEYRCAICHCLRTDNSLVVDHDHATNMVRGLLCDKCNLALGSFGDSEENLFNAIGYLRAHRESQNRSA